VRVTWVHPSWRDLVIERLASDESARRRFLAACGLDGALLAISTAGGSAGERELPLMLTDADWDVLSDRLAQLTGELDDLGASRLLQGLETACEEELGRRRGAELRALASLVLDLLRASWDRAGAPIPTDVLERWLALARHVPRVRPPDLTATWVELLPKPDGHDPSIADVRRLADWLRVAAALHRAAPQVLRDLGFPERYRNVLETMLDSARALVFVPRDDPRLFDLVEALRVLGALQAEYKPLTAWLVAWLVPPLPPEEPWVDAVVKTWNSGVTPRRVLLDL